MMLECKRCGRRFESSGPRVRCNRCANVIARRWMIAIIAAGALIAARLAFFHHA